tara:strand:- start:3156 stop:3551 length:396 start_codon:yes stop_codon:yes gene_type:complete
MTTRKNHRRTKQFSNTRRGGHNRTTKRTTKRILKGGKRRISKGGMGIWLQTKLKHYGIYDFNFNERFTITNKLKEIEHHKTRKEQKIWTNKSGLSEKEQNKLIEKIREEEKHKIIELLIKEVEKKHKHDNK